MTIAVVLQILCAACAIGMLAGVTLTEEGRFVKALLALLVVCVTVPAFIAAGTVA